LTGELPLIVAKMPIMNGSEATTRIRNFESKLKQPMPARHSTYGRIPIFAVSASLFEGRWIEYLENGFDGWILKPIDFGRLGKLLEGIRYPDARKSAEYMPGQWERGGWFLGSPSVPDGMATDAR
jgi:CheY-like chemotaxis protein